MLVGLVQQARLAQSVEHETLNLRVVGSSPTLGDRHFMSYFGTILDLANFHVLANSFDTGWGDR